MNMDFIRKLPTPQEIKALYPLSETLMAVKQQNDAAIRDIFYGKSNKMMLIIGPCSADREDAVIEYMKRLRDIQEKVKAQLVIIPRIYTNKPRTTGEGYKGMLHQPNPISSPDMLKGLIAIRKLHMRALAETGFSCADEMLYPENHRYLSDLLSYVAVGARSVENQSHRLTASGLDLPVGMKNPTSGDLGVMMNAIYAAQHAHTFIYRGWEVVSQGNPFTHAILRGYVDKQGESHPNYHYEDLVHLCEMYESSNLAYPCIVVDTNHANSNKHWGEQPRIALSVLNSMEHNPKIRNMVKGLMIESYLEDGAQKIDEGVFGKSITDPCLGWEKTEQLIMEIAAHVKTVQEKE